MAAQEGEGRRGKTRARGSGQGRRVRSEGSRVKGQVGVEGRRLRHQCRTCPSNRRWPRCPRTRTANPT
eukprot:393364-Rhodomonas_salina.1